MRTSKFGPLLLFLWLTRAFGDQVELNNGDRYSGNVLSVSASEIRLDSELGGLMKLPRNQVRAIFFGTNAGPQFARPMLNSRTNEPVGSDALSELKTGKIDPKTLEQVQTDILGTAGPEATAMFNDLLKGLTTGTLSAEDIRRQAKQAVNELKSLQKEAGEGEDNPILGSYLAILQKFIDEGSTNQTKRSSAAPLPKTR